jgi:hypothetical protein
MPGEVIVQPDQPRGGHRGRRKPREEPLRQARITIVKCHVRPEAMRGTGEGHYRGILRPPSTMTNANVEQTVAGDPEGIK